MTLCNIQMSFKRLQLITIIIIFANTTDIHCKPKPIQNLIKLFYRLLIGLSATALSAQSRSASVCYSPSEFIWVCLDNLGYQSLQMRALCSRVLGYHCHSTASGYFTQNINPVAYASFVTTVPNTSALQNASISIRSRVTVIQYFA